MSEKIKPNILVIGNLHKNPSANTFLQKFIRIIKEVGHEIYVISGNKPIDHDNILWINVKYGENPSENILKTYLLFLKGQLMLSWIILTKKLDYDKVIILPTSFFIPTLLLKLKGKKTAIFVAQELKSVILKSFIHLNFMISDLLIVESENVINSWKIEKYREKIRDGSVYVDVNLFKKDKKIYDRNDFIGYVGLLDNRKGTMELIKAISILDKKKGNNFKFIIGGIGILEDSVRKLSSKSDNVEFKGLIPNRSLPDIYNQLKLFVLPSISEGLPNVILEAMACGTIVLSTPVGGIPDIIEDGQNGFILENNSPECISGKIIGVLNSSDLEKISARALKLIEKKFTYESALNRYEEILNELC